MSDDLFQAALAMRIARLLSSGRWLDDIPGINGQSVRLASLGDARHLTISDIDALAAAFGVSTEWLLLGERAGPKNRK